MDLEIAETAPVIKRATATNRNKPTVLSNGVTVLVPEYLAAGEVVRINIEMVRFMSRVKEECDNREASASLPVCRIPCG
ncbi:MAG: hypothetical protein WBN03_01320 [Desulfobacterales bacterium]